MNPYIDYDYYVNTYRGESVQEGDFARLALFASYAVNSIAGNKIGHKIENVEDWQREYVRLATACQVDFMAGGGSKIDTSTSFSTMKIGEFNYTKDSSETSEVSTVVGDVSYMIYSYLESAGLYSRIVSEK